MAFFNKVYNGDSFSPLTSIFVNWSKDVLYFKAQNSCISSSVPGAWFPNWLHGKSNISNPLSWYSLYNFSNPSYWGVKPHPVAVLTIINTFPLKSLKYTSSLFLFFTYKT